MSAVIIEFDAVRAKRNPSKGSFRAAPTERDAILSHEFTFWRGATGTQYVHTVYSLLECPELPAANVVLVRRHPAGRAEILHIGRLENRAGSLNLAEVRQASARLGATEVHVHLLAGNTEEREAIERDLTGAGELASSSRH